jgi:hypothetical protein
MNPGIYLHKPKHLWKEKNPYFEGVEACDRENRNAIQTENITNTTLACLGSE